MRSDAFIVVTCDKCGCEIEIQLTAVARGYDERNVDGELDQAGWTTDSGDLCEDCSAASKESVHQ